MTGIVRAESRDRARSTQIGIACELRWKPGGAVPERTMDGGPRIRAGLGDPGFPTCNIRRSATRCPPPVTGSSPTARPPARTPIRFVRIPELTTEPARQRDEPPGNPMVRYRSSSCQANITDADRFLTPLPGPSRTRRRGS
jgi:hypothetical protein